MATIHKKGSSPFKATKLWNSLLSSFKEGMELKRRRWRLKSYDQCFSGSDASQWLYSYLQNHPSFGTHVTREQAFMLLQKFLENNVFQSVVEKNSKKFQDTNHLYRFIDDIPEKIENEKNSDEIKEDKENFASRNSLTNLIRTISKRNSKYFGENNPETSIEESTEEVKKEESEQQDQNKGGPPLGSVSITPLTKDFNHVSLQSASKDNPSFDYSNVSTLLFPTEDEDDADEVFETSIRNHFFTRSNSVQMRKRDSRPPSLRRPLGTLWINEFEKTETQLPAGNIDRKSDKKRTILRNFGKTSIHTIKKTTILGKRKSGDTLAQSADFPKLKKVSDKETFSEVNPNFTSIARKNKKGSQDSLSSEDALPRKALALLGENADHIQEVESYATYYPVKYERRRRNSSSKSSLAGSRENVGNTSKDKLNKLWNGSKNTRTSLNRLHSISNPININSRKDISLSNIDVSRSHPTINEAGRGSGVCTRSSLKKARSFSLNFPLPDKRSASPKLQRRPAQRHAMVRRSISQNNMKWRRLHPRTASASTGTEEGYPFTETDLIFDANRLYKVPSTWSIDTIGLMREAEEKNDENSPEITAEDVEETWKSVVILSLRKLLGLVSVKDLIDTTEISGANIMKNVSWKPSEISRDAPGWLLSAMNCLIDWPNFSQSAEDSILQDLPNYPGFERDVYRAVKEHYHTTLSRPLIPFHLYSLVQECADVLHENKEKGIRILQHIVLLLPCWNRRQLQLLVHFMNKVANNNLLHISKDLPNRDLVIHSFLNLIVRKEKQSLSLEASVIPIRIATLLIDSYDVVFKPPPSLRGQVDHKLAVILGKPSSSKSEPTSKEVEKKISPEKVQKQVTSPRYYCRQISKEAFEKEALDCSRKAIHDVLTAYINDPNFTEKERSKRLKQFQKAYPEIYAERFHDDVSNCSTMSEFSVNFKEASKPSFLREKLL